MLKRSSGLAACILHAAVVLSQAMVSSAQATIAFGPGPTKSIEQLLNERGVTTSTVGLVEALQSPDEGTRGMAASVLAERNILSAHEQIYDAYERTKLSVPKFNLAQALLRLDAKTGSELLSKMCRDAANSPAIRLRTVAVLQDGNNHVCDQEIVGILQRADEPALKEEGLAILVRTPTTTVSVELRRKIEGLLLNDENEAVRIAAAQALLGNGDSESMNLVKKRITIERSPRVSKELTGLVG